MARVKDGDGLVYESTERRRREETAGEEPPTNASEFETPKGTAEMEVDPIQPPTDASKIESRKGTADMEEDTESEKKTPKETTIDKTELAREAERENDPTEGFGGLNGSGEASIDAVEGRDGPETEEPPRETENVILMEKGNVGDGEDSEEEMANATEEEEEKANATEEEEENVKAQDTFEVDDDAGIKTADKDDEADEAADDDAGIKDVEAADALKGDDDVENKGNDSEDRTHDFGDDGEDVY